MLNTMPTSSRIFFNILEVAGRLGPVDDDLPFLVFLEPIDASDQGGSPIPRGRKSDAFTLGNRQIDVPPAHESRQTTCADLHVDDLVVRRFFHARADRLTVH